MSAPTPNAGADEVVTAAILVIGDEILSGRTKDKNIGYIAEHCTNIGIQVKEVRVVPDIEGEIVTGRVVNLRKTMQLGAISGPAFEAKLETARGSGTVRYLLTRQGLELLGVQESARPAMAN